MRWGDSCRVRRQSSAHTHRGTQPATLDTPFVCARPPPQVYLPELLTLALCLLEGAVGPLHVPHTETTSQDASAAGERGQRAQREAAEGAKEIRGRCLRLLASALTRFPSSIDYNFLWPRLLETASHLMPRLALEVAAPKVPPLMEMAAALAAPQTLAPVLADCSSGGPCAGGEADVGVQGSAAALQPCGEAWAAERSLGSALLGACVASLSEPHASDAARACVLGMVEGLFDMPQEVAAAAMARHTPALLEGLQSLIVAAWRRRGGGSGGDAGSLQHKRRTFGPQAHATQKQAAATGAKVPKRALALRALALLELVGSKVRGWSEAGALTGALLPLLQLHEGGAARRRADEDIVTRALGALRAVWSRCIEIARADAAGMEDLGANADQLKAVSAALAALFGSLQERDSRIALSDVYTALGALDAEHAQAAGLLAGLNAYSTTQVGAAPTMCMMPVSGE
jgi:U3 small nucleolar RNA-associated protein 20